MPFFEIVDFPQVDNLEFGDYQSDQLINEYIGLEPKRTQRCDFHHWQ